MLCSFEMKVPYKLFEKKSDLFVYLWMLMNKELKFLNGVKPKKKSLFKTT